MRLFLLWLNTARIYRAIWHRKQHQRLIGKVGAYLEDLGHDW